MTNEERRKKNIDNTLRFVAFAKIAKDSADTFKFLGFDKELEYNAKFDRKSKAKKIMFTSINELINKAFVVEKQLSAMFPTPEDQELCESYAELFQRFFDAIHKIDFMKRSTAIEMLQEIADGKEILNLDSKEDENLKKLIKTYTESVDKKYFMAYVKNFNKI